MRKYLWLGSLMLVAAALGVYWTAHFAAEHPGSFFTRCLSAARLGFNLSSPVLQPVATKESGHHIPVAFTKTSTTTPHLTKTTKGPRSCRVPKPVPTVPPSEPVEVIKIEQIDPQVAKVIADVLEVQAILRHEDKASTSDKGPDHVVYTILDPEGPIQFSNPNYEDTVPQVSQCPQVKGKSVGLQMPYCDLVQQESSCAKVHNLRPETTSLVMPYVDEEQFESVETQEEGTREIVDEEVPENMMEHEEMPMPEAVANPQGREPSYHHSHHEEGCPYLNGHSYCPRYSQPYYPPQQPDDMRQPREQPTPMTEPAAPQPIPTETGGE